jgi:YD repeat-containing protein
MSNDQIDPNGTAFVIPLHLSGCTSGGQPLSDRYSFSQPVAKVVCRPGYSVFVPSGATSSICAIDAASAQAGDATNEQGAPLNCDCNENLVPSAAPNAVGPELRRGKPVNAANGNESFAHTDYEGAGGNLLNFKRYYNSGAGFGTRYFPTGWSHSYAYRALFAGANDPVTLVRPDGSSFSFTKNGSGTWVGPSYLRGSLSVTLSGSAIVGVTYTRGDGTKEVYSRYGIVSSIVFAQGGTLTFSGSDYLTGVSDGRGHSLTFTYGSAYSNGPTRVVKLTDQAGTVVSYGYDSQARLTSVTYPGTATRRYGYLGLSDKLTSIVDENGTTFASITYDSAGRATSTQFANGVDLTTFTYNSGSTTVGYASGLTETMSFSQASAKPMLSGSLLCGSSGCSSGSVNDQYVYDANGNVSAVTNRLGVTTCFAFDAARNLPTRVVDNIGSPSDCSAALSAPPSTSRVTTYSWHALFDVPMAVARPQSKTLYNYDSAGRVLTLVEVETSDLTGAQGLSAAATGSSRATNFTYNAQGSLLTVKAPRSDATTTYAYDANQNLTSVTDPVGLTTTFSNYNGRGQPQLITAPNGLQTSLTYDGMGRVIQMSAGGVTTGYGYDLAGQLTTVSMPSGVVLTLGYDAAHRLVSTQDSLGNRVDRTLDAAGNVLQETVKGSGGAIALSRQAAYDQLSRITSLTKVF